MKLSTESIVLGYYNVWTGTSRTNVHIYEQKILFHQDNVPAHKSAAMVGKLYELKYELIPNSPYFPYLDLCDISLSPKLKK